MVSGLLLRRIFLTLAETSSRVSLGMRGQWCGITTSTTRFSESSLPNPDSVVSYKQLKNMLSTHNVQLFDVRNQDEFMAGRIPDSVNIPLSQLEESLKLSPEQFQLQFEVKAPGKDDDNLVFHCQKGRRSAEALAIARQLGFNRARHYQGGTVNGPHMRESESLYIHNRVLVQPYNSSSLSTAPENQYRNTRLRGLKFSDTVPD